MWHALCMNVGHCDYLVDMETSHSKWEFMDNFHFLTKEKRFHRNKNDSFHNIKGYSFIKCYFFLFP